MASLVYHVRTHTKSKPYVCTLPSCEFVTATKGNLKAHLLSNQHKLSTVIFLLVICRKINNINRDSMSLELLNVILSLDTKHGRPEVSLHGPRERRNHRKSPRQSDSALTHHGFNLQKPPRKRSRGASSKSLLSIIFASFTSYEYNLICCYLVHWISINQIANQSTSN